MGIATGHSRELSMPAEGERLPLREPVRDSFLLHKDLVSYIHSSEVFRLYTLQDAESRLRRWLSGKEHLVVSRHKDLRLNPQHP